MKTLAMSVTVILSGFLLIACSQEPPPSEKPAPATPAAKVEQKSPATGNSVTTETRQTVETVKQETAAAVETVKQETAAAVETVKQQSAAAVASVQQQAGETAESAQTAATEATNQARQTVTGMLPASATPSDAAAPETVIYQAMMGKVTFNHAEHAGRLDCSQCHPTDPPQKIVIDKDVAHDQLCKVCHKESGGNAPTGCTGCHKK